MQGASPLASPGLNPGGTGFSCGKRVPAGGACLAGCRQTLPFRNPLGGLPSLSPAYPAFSLLSCPHPPDPLPLRGRGRLKVILCKGLRPLHPRAEPGRHRLFLWKAGSGGGACLAGCRQTLPFRNPLGGLPSLSPAYPAFSLLSCPHPPDPLPLRGRGRFKVYFAGGYRPRHPCNRMGCGTGFVFGKRYF